MRVVQINEPNEIKMGIKSTRSYAETEMLWAGVFKDKKKLAREKSKALGQMSSCRSA
jgi:hypothetical protein